MTRAMRSAKLLHRLRRSEFSYGGQAGGKELLDLRGECFGGNRLLQVADEPQLQSAFAVAEQGRARGRLGIVTEKCEPTPNSLSARILPPSKLESFWHKYNPNPVPS
jgi:hypothetical protein